MGSSHPLPRRLSLFLGVLASWSGAALAHPRATSSIDARTEGPAVHLVFKLDATSVRDVTGVDGEEVVAGVDKLAGYLDSHLVVTADGAPCTRGPLTRATYVAATNRVELAARWSCARVMARLRVESTMFVEETTPHQVLLTLRHRRALERYHLNKSEAVVDVELARLHQLGAGDDGQFRTATPPPGAFAAAARALDEPRAHASFRVFVGWLIVALVGGGLSLVALRRATRETSTRLR